MNRAKHLPGIYSKLIIHLAQLNFSDTTDGHTRLDCWRNNIANREIYYGGIIILYAG